MKRPARWQAEKAATAKAMRALPMCETPECPNRAFGTLWNFEAKRTWRLCVQCAGKAVEAQRAQREKIAK